LASLLYRFFGFELSGPLDQHQEQNARLTPGVSYQLCALQLRDDLFINSACLLPFV
jgi:hypothetical protein